MDPPEIYTIDGVDVEYVARGMGTPFVMLPGTIGNLEIFIPLIQRLFKNISEEDLRCISVSYPIGLTFLEVVDFFCDFIKSLDSPVILLGTSVGGWIAQHVNEKIPKYIKMLILSNTYSSTRYFIKHNMTMFRLSRFLPHFFYRATFLRQIKSSIETYEAAPQFIKVIRKNLSQLSKNELRRRLFWNLARNVRESDGLWKNKPVNCILISTRDDTVLAPFMFDQLQETYPDALIYLLERGSHYPYFLVVESYAEIIEDVLQNHL